MMKIRGLKGRHLDVMFGGTTVRALRGGEGTASSVTVWPSHGLPVVILAPHPRVDDDLLHWMLAVLARHVAGQPQRPLVGDPDPEILAGRDPNPAPGKVRACACGFDPGYVSWSFCPTCAARLVPEWGYYHAPQLWHVSCKGCTDDRSRWGRDVPEPPAPREGARRPPEKC